MSACPSCGQIKTQVVETRTMQNGWTRRWRFCFGDCQSRWYTYEVPDSMLSLSGFNENDLKEFPRVRDRRKKV